MHKHTKYAAMIAAPRSNSGKTLVTLGLIRALQNAGHTVQPFKCGPDYIDPMHHEVISGRCSYNLDSWMDNTERVIKQFYVPMQNADFGIVEGVMGLFDGAQKDVGSSAEIARLLSLPVILVVDASSVAYSVAPLLHGFKTFDKRVKLGGVIFNKTGSLSHVNFLAEAATDAQVKMLGFIPRDNRLAMESRYLGLHLPGEHKNTDVVEVAAHLIEQHVDLQGLTEAIVNPVHFTASKEMKPSKEASLNIAVAYDEAFNFMYPANIDAISSFGKVTFFSPLKDQEIPETDFVWLSGGYPELFARKLSANQRMINSLRRFIDAGKPVVAECGGMMYLGKELIDEQGQAHSMAGIFDFSTTFAQKNLHLGYRAVQVGDFMLKGHEFHYSTLLMNAHKPYISMAKTARGKDVPMPVFRYKNCWASYMHLYLGDPEKMRTFVNHLRTYE